MEIQEIQSTSVSQIYDKHFYVKCDVKFSFGQILVISFVRLQWSNGLPTSKDSEKIKVLNLKAS